MTPFRTCSLWPFSRAGHVIKNPACKGFLGNPEPETVEGGVWMGKLGWQRLMQGRQPASCKPVLDPGPSIPLSPNMPTV